MVPDQDTPGVLVPAIHHDLVFQSPLAPVLYDGCDFRLYFGTLLACILAGVSLFTLIQHLPGSLYIQIPVIGLFLAVRAFLRREAKRDPLHFTVYLRSLKYRSCYPPLSRMRPGRYRHRIERYRLKA